MADESTPDDTGHATDGTPRIHNLHTYFRVFQNPDRFRVYYRTRDGPVTVPELRDELDLSKSSAYNYIDELVDAGLLVELADAQGATQYSATNWTLTIEIDGDALRLAEISHQKCSRQDVRTNPSLGIAACSGDPTSGQHTTTVRGTSVTTIVTHTGNGPASTGDTKVPILRPTADCG